MHPMHVKRMISLADNLFVIKKQLVERFDMDREQVDKEFGLGDIDYVE